MMATTLRINGGYDNNDKTISYKRGQHANEQSEALVPAFEPCLVNTIQFLGMYRLTTYALR